MLMRAIAELTSGAPINEDMNRAITQAGIGVGVATMLRGTARHLGHALIYLPSDLLDEAGVPARDAMRLISLGPDAVGARAEEPREELAAKRRALLDATVRPLAQQAQRSLDSADAQLAALPRVAAANPEAVARMLPSDAAARAACLPRVAAGVYLRGLAASAYDPVHPSLLEPNRGMGVPRLSLQARLLWRYLQDGVR